MKTLKRVILWWERNKEMVFDLLWVVLAAVLFVIFNIWASFLPVIFLAFCAAIALSMVGLEMAWDYLVEWAKK